MPQGARQARIEAFTHDGRGVARVDGKVVFIEGALPGEEVSFVYTAVHRDHGEGRVEAVLTAAPDRVTPRCPQYADCGGCSLQHLSAPAQIAMKQGLLVEQLRHIGKIAEVPLWPPLLGPVWGYRRKARLSVRYVARKGRALVGFRDRTGAWVADLAFCPTLHPVIGERLQALSELVGSLSIKTRVPQIEVAVGDRRAALVFRTLDDPSAEDRAQLAAFGERFGFDIYLQRHGPESILPVWPEAPEPLRYALPDQGLEFRFKATEFIQVNAAVNRALVDRVVEVLRPEPGERVLDLFCGLGNFTLALARHAGEVVGAEGVPELVQRARENAAANALTNAEFYLADLTQPLDGQAWAFQRYHKVLLDPARGGAQEVLAGVPHWGASRILYVSCNPATLARDAGLLVHRHGYRLVRAGVLDMFPHTAHVESMALFER
ncbi:23S rRNA (uracil(1939)-C(5))-methyltransferase RlmD [Candidatus Methylocalor cossyra]|uniref:23S rRNA (uracil(1939)-C(5))-methyltransferase RlmD n=1 Tax=Candidatus Methylocalor cossyra TaxID=3108543 RepID=A0ABP1C9V5_9GAMM